MNRSAHAQISSMNKTAPHGGMTRTEKAGERQVRCISLQRDSEQVNETKGEDE